MPTSLAVSARAGRSSAYASRRRSLRVKRRSHRGAVLTGYDLTSQKQTQQQLELFRRLIDQSSEAIFVVDPQDARILDVNERACSNLGYTRAELLALSIPEIEAAYDGFTWSEQVEQARLGRVELIETGQRRKNGDTFPVEISVKFVHLDGRGYIVAAARDITEKKQLEIKYLRAQRMESIGRLAGGIAHDLNNVLAPVILGVQMLRLKMPDAEAQDVLSLMECSAQRGAGMIRQILAFARGLKGHRAPVPLRDLINEMVKIGRETFSRSIQLRVVVPTDLWFVTGDATQLHQVLMNLCLNACDAMPEGGVLELRAENRQVDESLSRGHPGAQTGPHVLISIRDTGVGIAPQLLDKVFEPFFTTKAFGKGTGLGLATTLGIVQGHGGFLTVESKLNEGTCFKIYLPADSDADVEQALPAAASAPHGAHELILVVDDEKAIRLITQSVLVAHGYEVLLAKDGAEAVALFKARQPEINAVIMDLAMPFMDGTAAIQAIRKMDPAARILAVSGLSDSERLAAAPGLAGLAILAKPYAPAQVLQALSEVLGKETNRIRERSPEV
jgi:two-component system, cell cycle sensor histidine kinase and response regulator CckA